MPKQNLVVVGAKLDMGRNPYFDQVEEDCELVIMGLPHSERSKFIKQFSEDKGTRNPEQYLEQSLRSLNPKKVSRVYVKPLSQPAYLIHVVPETEPREKLQELLLTKLLPDTFIYCSLTKDKIEPLSEKEQEIAENWLSGKK